MAWYDEVNIYELLLTNGKWMRWTTSLSYSEVKEAIGQQSFVLVSFRDEKGVEINTKVIESIKDITEEERLSLRRNEEDKQKRLAIIQEIRSIPLSRYDQWKLGLNKKKPKELDWFDKAVGVDIDPLMVWNENYLEELLAKCKRKARKVV